jgi:hypothetical protein
MKRIVQPEILDTLAPDDPHALRSRRDLRRVNAWMGNYSIMARALQNNFNGPAKKQITELGAGDGNFLLRVAQKINSSNVSATLLDQKKNVSAETLARFSKLGWRAEAVVADVFDWPQTSEGAEVVIANLFLHHFKDPHLAELLQTISRRAKSFIAIEPHRFRFALPSAQLLRLIGCSAITLHDAAASIRAGFLFQEISTLWPDKKNWQLTECRAGLFSHLFIAQRKS